MEINTIPKYERYAYAEKCTCGKTTIIYTQNNHVGYEYDTHVYVQCACGLAIRFILPVN